MKLLIKFLIKLLKFTNRKCFIVVYKDKNDIFKYSKPMRWLIAKDYFKTFDDAVAIDFKLNIPNIKAKNGN